MSRALHYKERQCEKCQGIYTPSAANQKWCSNCLLKPCRQCGTLFSVGKPRRFEIAQFCSRKCQGEYVSLFRTGSNAYGFKDRIAEVHCANCGKPTQKAKRFVERFENSFCDRKCQGEYYRNHRGDFSGENSPKWSGGNAKNNCEWCGSEYEVFRAVADKSRFCSTRCLNDWHSSVMRGENSSNWRGGTTKERALDMASREYKEWRQLVFERDGFTCQNCGDKRGHNLRAHHILAWARVPELRHDINNGVTLCEDCHKNVHAKQRRLINGISRL